MIICDLCGKAKDRLQKEIEGKEYDICSECWNPLAQKLRGKGRTINREAVFLPPPRDVKEREDEDPRRATNNQRRGALRLPDSKRRSGGHQRGSARLSALRRKRAETCLVSRSPENAVPYDQFEVNFLAR